MSGLELVLLAAIWGGSFLFMRIASPQFGALPLTELRVAIAMVVLTSCLALRSRLATLRGRWRALFLLGALNSALPFALFAYATRSLAAGFSAVLNATVPLFGALLGWVWLRERLSPRKAVGLLLGFVGVVTLVWDKLSFAAERSAVAAGLGAAVCYAFSAHWARRHLAGVPPLALAAGSQVAASALLFPLALAALPPRLPSPSAWGCGIALGVFCTGVAYLLYFRLLARVGAARSMLVTYLIPLFAMLWGFLFLQEPITSRTLIGGVVIVTGVVLVVRAPALPGATR